MPLRGSPDIASHAAEACLKEFEITSLPVRPIQIAEEKLDIQVMAKPASSKGVSGMLIRNGNDFGIAYATHITSKGFQNFSVGHEIGHYRLDGHIDQLFASGQSIHQSHAGFLSKDPYEKEADFFSAALLMPETLFKKELRTSEVGLDAIMALADTCETSLVATAIRYAQLTDYASAIVISTGQRIDYCFMSDSLKSISGLEWIRSGDLLPGASASERFNADADNVATGRRVDDVVAFSDWFGKSIDVELSEEVKGLGSYGKTLTVLTTPNDLAQDEIDEDEELEDSYNPKFRR